MGQRGSKIEVTKADRAILQLKISKDEIHKYARRTESLIASEDLQLRNIIKADPKASNKNPRARLLLKKIHYQRRLLEQASDQLINLENMVATVEFKLVEQQFIIGLRQGNEILTKLNKEFTGVDDLMDQVQDQIAYQDEIDQVLSSSIVGSYEDELERELKQLDREVNGSVKQSEMPSVEGPTKQPEMPSVEGLPEPQPEREEPAVEEERPHEAPLLA
ncbi:LAMI_0G05710g1_1 [Lachancea mirantina]|uniref:LAMI_0G05710g1_1 n=1 Tax=Lachancea mirantina TaxID=1230905 RepID=A0A1G4K8W2_9SACH|nr:LAMI_0G05710g1_1 [Lachancea mirantina]